MDRISTTIPNQQTIAGVAHSVTTADGRFAIRFPLPKPHGRPVELLNGPTARFSALQHRINRLLNDGHAVICPLTGKLIEVYRRGLHRSQVRMLERLRDRADLLGTPTAYLPLVVFTGRSDGDLAKLALWGLAETLKPASRYEKESCRGKWRVTERGRAWLAGHVRIPRQVAVLLGERLGYVDERDLIGPEDTPDTFDAKALAEGTDGGVAVAPQPEAACR